jgi:hypothetical protein
MARATVPGITITAALFLLRKMSRPTDIYRAVANNGALDLTCILLVGPDAARFMESQYSKGFCGYLYS